MKNKNRFIFAVLIILISITGLQLLRERNETAKHQFADFNPNNFDKGSTTIENIWFPLKPGKKWVYEGTFTEAGKTFAHRIEFTVTDLTKEIADVGTVVAWVVDYRDGEVVEKEIAFYAKDNGGNVWYFGEYPEEYEGGKFVAAPTWISGIKDAKAGIKMWADPKLGTPSYFQGWGPAVDWTDYSQVDQIGQKTCLVVACYENVLVMAESSLDEKGTYQLKYYAPGVGNVRVSWKGNDAIKEELELVDFVQLFPEGLAEIRSKALELEKHAYENSKDVYAHTKPAQHTPITKEAQ